jgi:hypothetical protein
VRHSPIALPAVAALTALLAGEHARAQTTHPLYACAHRIAGGLRGFAEDVTHALVDCETDRLATGSPADCAADTSLAARLANIVDDLPRLANHADCDTAGNPADQSGTRLRALCPIESRTTSLFTERVGGDGIGTVLSDLGTLADDLFVSVYDGCPRPTSRVSAGARECATLIADAATRELEQLVQCYYSCERAHLADDDFCVDPSTGVPAADDVLRCIEGHAEDIADVAGNGDKCSAAEIVEIGCPLGATDEATLVAALTERLTSSAQALNRKTYHSSCRTSLPGPPVELVPAKVTLEPSMTKTEVSCGQILDAAFFGANSKLSFDTDLNCGPVTEVVNGIVVAKNGVTINGRDKSRQISGPTSRSLRRGAGIVVAEGVKRVTIAGFRRIQNFAVGVLAQGNNRKLTLKNSTLFRNLEAGIRSGSAKTKVVEVIADRNGIGFHLSGNDSVIKRSSSRGSFPQSASAADPLSPGWGFHLSGTDVDLDGVTVRCAQCMAQGDVVGFVLEGDGQLVETSSARGSLEDGVRIGGTANRFRNNSVKLNLSHGIVVDGSANAVNKNHSDENGGAGFVVSGSGNVLTGNGSGSLTDKGNAGVGYLVTGADNRLDTNEAEANGGGGFSIGAPTALFKGNRAEGNAGVGIELTLGGTPLDSNVAEKNSGAEWVVASDNEDRSGNRANGRTIAIPPAGGTFE